METSVGMKEEYSRLRSAQNVAAFAKQALVTSASTTHDRLNAQSTAAIASGLSKI
jgi:hypothetical protein